MKTITRPINWLICGLILGTTAYSCKKKDDVEPTTYTFAGLDNIKMPELTQTTPAAVSATAGTVTSSTLAAAVGSALSSMSASGPVPAAVQQAGAAMGQAVSASKAAAMTSSFTSDMVNSGTLSADMKKEVAAMASNASLKAYMPSYTLPTVNGKPVGARIGAVGINPVAVANSVQQNGPTDACQQAATTAYNTVLQRLDAAKATQVATLNTTYAQYESAANGEVAGCQAGVPTKSEGLRTTLRTQMTSSMTVLNSVRAKLGDVLYNQLALMAYVGYFQSLDNANTVQAADLTTCSAIKDAKIAAAKTARDTDLNTVTTNYNAQVMDATAARTKAVASCHNQGNGG